MFGMLRADLSIMNKVLIATFGKLRRNQSGAIAPMFGAAIAFLVFIMAMALETGRWVIAQNELQVALDAAVLAGAKHFQDTHNQAGAIALANVAFQANRSKRRFNGDIAESISFSIVDNNSMQAQGTSNLNTVVAKVIGRNTLPLLGRSGATNRATVTNSEFELALMLDITGSMCDDPPDTVSEAPCTRGVKLDGMKAAAVKLVDKMLGTTDLQSRVKIALIPFSDGVRLPKSAANLPVMQIAAAGTSPGAQTFDQVNTSEQCTGSGKNRKCETVTTHTYYYYHPTECVAERTGGNAYTDAAPGPNSYVMWAMQRRNSVLASSTATEMGCSLGTASTFEPLTNQKTKLTTKINGLAAKGGTAGHIGTAWAWYSLSPNWNNVTGSGAKAYVAKDDKSLRKIAVLMTDGEYNNDFSRGPTGYPQSCANASASVRSCGYKVGSVAYTTSANSATSAAQALALCKAMKDPPNNIEVYTVGYAVNSTAEAMLKKCASSELHFFKADTANALSLAFDGIAQRVLALYLSQ
jgi:Flp pilus assembly protein TadG